MVGLIAPAGAASLSIWGEVFAPLSYYEKGKISGIASEIVENMVNDSGVSVDKWILAPWARAFKTAKERPNILLYSVVRKPDREDLFHWIGPFSDRKISLYKLKKREDIKIFTKQEVMKYKVGALRQAAANETLTSVGVDLDETRAPETQFLKLVRGRNDLSIFLDVTLFHLAKKFGYSSRDFKSVMLLDDSKKYYITLSKNSDPEIVDALKSSFIKIKKSGKLDEIINKYLGVKPGS